MADWFDLNDPYATYNNSGINPYDPGTVLPVNDGNGTDRGANIGPWAQGYGQQPADVVVPLEPQSQTGGSFNYDDPRTWTPESLQAFYESRGGKGPWSEIGYWMSKRQELYDRGQQVGDPGYGFMRLGKADSITPPEQRYMGGSTSAGLSPGDLLKPFTEQFTYEDFKAPGKEALDSDPGFQASLDKARDTLQRSAAAKGSLLSGSTLQGLSDQTASMTQGAYSDLFGRELTSWKNNQDNRFQQYAQRRANHYQNQDSPFAKLFGLAQLESSNMNQANNLAFQYAQTGANILGNSGRQQNDLTTQGGNAAAAGQIGAGNAYSGMFGDLSQIPWYLAAQRRGNPGYSYTDQLYGN